jgi:hypothetical protein
MNARFPLSPEATARTLREYRNMLVATATPRHVYAARISGVMDALGFLGCRLDADQAVYQQHADLMGEGRHDEAAAIEAAAIEAAHADLFPLAAE